MQKNGILGTGISAHKGRDDLADFARILDEVEALGVEAIDLPTYDMDIVVAGKIRQAPLDIPKAACRGRQVTYTVHGPLAINFFDEPSRLAATWR